jgi:hypothetical protein
VNFEPLQTTLSEFFAFSQHQQSSRKIIAHVIEMRRHGIDSSSEINIMREIEILDFAESTGRVELEKKTAFVTELVSDFLNHFLDFGGFLVVPFGFQFCCVLVHQFRVPFGNLTFASSFAPDFLDYCQNFCVYFPWN